MDYDNQKTTPRSIDHPRSDLVISQREKILELPCLYTVIQSLPYPSFIINSERQILASNEAFRKMISIESDETILGARPGDILNCIHADNSTGGCGTSDMCEFCGALNTMLESQKTRKTYQREARLITHDKGVDSHFDLLITSSPLEAGDDSLFLLTMVDTTSQKRRRLMEHVFFHDVLNTAFGLMGTLQFIKEADKPDQVMGLIENSQRIAENLVEEITYQKNILAAESGDLKTSITQVHSTDLLKNVIISTLKSQSSKGRGILIAEGAEMFSLYSDEKLLRRVLINMTMNALEASEKGDEVILNSELDGKEAVFTVQNKGVIPRDVQGQLWQRTFSTKGSDRGIGTYSMKMFTEQYLGGSVDFISNEEKGTIFSVRLKLE